MFKEQYELTITANDMCVITDAMGVYIDNLQTVIKDLDGEDKAEAQIWLNGALAAMEKLKNAQKKAAEE